MPAGDFHTPRDASVRAITPATAPHGANGSGRFSRSGFADPDAREEERGVLAAGGHVGDRVAAVTSEASSQPLVMNGGSTSTMARRSFGVGDRRVPGGLVDVRCRERRAGCTAG